MENLCLNLPPTFSRSKIQLFCKVSMLEHEASLLDFLINIQINKKEELASTDMEKADVLKEFFPSVFTGSQVNHASLNSPKIGRASCRERV